MEDGDVMIGDRIGEWTDGDGASFDRLKMTARAEGVTDDGEPELDGAERHEADGEMATDIGVLAVEIFFTYNFLKRSFDNLTFKPTYKIAIV